MTASESDMWRRVLHRDPSAEGEFVYGVVTTGVFCRPTCPSRRPQRVNVRFFAGPREAQAAGLRPCLRCDPLGSSTRDKHLAAVKEACGLLRRDGDTPPLAALATAVGMSPWHFQRTFKRVVGITPKQYGMACRERRFRDLLRADHGVTDAVYGAGYNSPGGAYAAAKDGLGMTPSRYRGGGAHVIVRYAFAQTALGWIVVAVTGKGVCGIELGESTAALREAIRGRFPRARLVEDRDALHRLTETVVRFVDRPAAGLDLPLDIQGTAFQRRVWRALRDIPAGETRSYGEIARAIGRPGAARAVGSACAGNPVALAIPCHRAVRAGGEPGGYRWGEARKRRLLKWEKKR